MPKVLDELPKASRSGRSPKYDYDQWFKTAQESKGGIELIRGSENEVKAGKADFDAEVRTMRHNLYRHSKKRDLTIETVTIPSEDGKESLAMRISKKTASTGSKK
jgi:hypothetical protein